MPNGFFFLGASLVGLSLGGKAFVRFYKSVLNKEAFASKLVLGKYYMGGFEQPMNRREASLILGISQHSNSKQVQDAHRKLMFLNHPDNGGSTFLAAKVNEAKEILMQGSGGQE